MFKASTGVPSDRSWSDLWFDQGYDNNDDVAALITQPGPVFKAPLANSWDDNSGIDEVMKWNVLTLAIG